MKNTKLKRIIAWIIIILLAGAYISTLVLALLGFGLNSNLFAFSIIATFVLPILGFVIIYLYDRYNGLKGPGDPE